MLLILLGRIYKDVQLGDTVACVGTFAWHAEEWDEGMLVIVLHDIILEK